MPIFPAALLPTSRRVPICAPPRSPAVTEAQLLQEFEGLAERLGIRVSRENLEDGPGGFCTIRGERRFILDRKLDVRSQVEIFAREMARLPLDDMYVVPRVRERIDAHRETHV